MFSVSDITARVMCKSTSPVLREEAMVSVHGIDDMPTLRKEYSTVREGVFREGVFREGVFREGVFSE